MRIVKPDTKWHPEIPYVYASPDGIIEGRPAHGFEAKLVSWRAGDGWGEEGTDAVPERVLVQTHQQMEVFGFERVTVGALISGDLRVYEVGRSDALIEILAAKRAEFWAMVLARVPPEPDFCNQSTADLLTHLYGVRELEIDLPPEAAEWVTVLAHARQGKSLLKREEEKAKARLAHYMGEAAVGHVGGLTVRRRAVHRAGYQCKPCDFVTFTILEQANDANAVPAEACAGG